MSSDNPLPAGGTARWLALDFVEFEAKEPFDLVIVGSGYGAAMAAATFAGSSTKEGRPVRIALLERGKEYLPGAFPSSLDELPGHVRISRAGKNPIGRRDGLFDVRLAGDVSALVGNGLGGGSLINAGVMVEPRWGEFQSRMPRNVEEDLQSRWMAEAKRMLGGEVRDTTSPIGWTPNTVDRHADIAAVGPLVKSLALQQLASAGPDPRLAGLPQESAAITVRLSDGDNEAQAVGLPACSLCGDCLTGCNVGAKASLDVQLLADARRRGLAVFTSASVQRLHRVNGLWALEVEHTDPRVQHRRGSPVTILTERVVLAAGSLGSTEILLRSSRRSDKGALALSARLGEQFSLNGDNTATIRFPHDVQALGDERVPLSSEGGVSPRRIGPEITHTIRWPAAKGDPGFLVQEFSVPAPLRGLFQEIVGTRAWLDDLFAGDCSTHREPEEGERDPLAIDDAALRRELMVGLIGHDSATGRIVLPHGSTHEGGVAVKWPDVGRDPAMASAFERLQERVKQRLGAVGARVTPNPLWRLVPHALRPLLGDERNGESAPQMPAGGALTVHPLGGCAMGDSTGTGVVDRWNAVYNLDPDTDDWQGSLLVLDGAAVPASLGANPALTIAALSLRAAHHWHSVWNWGKPGDPARPSTPVTRPRARPLDACLPTPAKQPVGTEVRIVERLWGCVDGLRGPDGSGKYVVEVSFGFQPAKVSALIQPLRKHLPLDAANPGANTLRIYRHADWEAHSLDALDVSDDRASAHGFALVEARLGGHMRLLTREPSHAFWRTLRALAAMASRPSGGGGWLRGRSLLSPAYLRTLLALASRAGEARRFDYDAHVTRIEGVRHPEQRAFWTKALLHQPVRGHKRFTLACGENPWNQLLYLELDALGHRLLPAMRMNARLKLDARFLAHRGVALLSIARQDNQVRALTDLAHLGLYFARLFIQLHLAHMRQPEAPTAEPPRRLPGALRGLPPPDITEIALEPAHPGGQDSRKPPPAQVRLTRYRQPGSSTHPPLVFIHGYSASGTTFAHEAIEHSAVRHFWAAGRDVWVVDLRTSAGMPTARDPWRFEDVAWADLPVAIEHIATRVGHERGTSLAPVDVFAHCIGGVMLSMALLTDADMLHQQRAPGAPSPTRYPDPLQRLPHLIRKVVLSQKGFVVQYTGANLLRSYLIDYVKSALTGGYSFRPPPLPRLRDRLLDGFLATLPYPPDEERVDRAMKGSQPWRATRRRMDALYERTFNLARMPAAVLRRIDDFFGPLNLRTVSGVIRFAQEGTIEPLAVGPISLDRLSVWPRGGTLLLSSRDNGMVHPFTTRVMQDMLVEHGIPHVQRSVLEGGHQDVLIGDGALVTWRIVEAFLDGD